jgi:hypothetical protein
MRNTKIMSFDPNPDFLSTEKNRVQQATPYTPIFCLTKIWSNLRIFSWNWIKISHKNWNGLNRACFFVAPWIIKYGWVVPVPPRNGSRPSTACILHNSAQGYSYNAVHADLCILQTWWLNGYIYIRWLDGTGAISVASALGTFLIHTLIQNAKSLPTAWTQNICIWHYHRMY